MHVSNGSDGAETLAVHFCVFLLLDAYLLPRDKDKDVYDLDMHNAECAATKMNKETKPARHKERTRLICAEVLNECALL